MSKTTQTPVSSNLRQSKAKIAEDWIAQGLREKGWQIIGRNFRAVGAELDIVALKQGTIAVVEVKARAHALQIAQNLVELLPPKKRRALQRGILAYLQKFPCDYRTIRFDLALVIIKNPVQRPGLKYFVSVFDA